MAIEAYMAGRIGFYGISEIVEAVCSSFSETGRIPATVAEAFAVDGGARILARKLVSTKQD